jgi:hypothetical protein
MGLIADEGEERGAEVRAKDTSHVGGCVGEKDEGKVGDGIWWEEGSIAEGALC